MQKDQPVSYDELSKKWSRNGLNCFVVLIVVWVLFLIYAFIFYEMHGHIDFVSAYLFTGFITVVLFVSMVISFGISGYYAIRMQFDENKRNNERANDQGKLMDQDRTLQSKEEDPT